MCSAVGVTLDARDLRVLGKHVEGEKAELRPGLLRPMSARARAAAAAEQHRWPAATRRATWRARWTCTEDMLRIAPDHADLWRQAAVMNQRLDRVSAALRCFDRFLALHTEGDAGNPHPRGD